MSARTEGDRLRAEFDELEGLVDAGKVSAAEMPTAMAKLEELAAAIVDLTPEETAEAAFLTAEERATLATLVMERRERWLDPEGDHFPELHEKRDHAVAQLDGILTKLQRA